MACEEQRQVWAQLERIEEPLEGMAYKAVSVKQQDQKAVLGMGSIRSNGQSF